MNIDEKPMTKIKRRHLSGYFYATLKEKHLTRSFTRRDSACTDKTHCHIQHPTDIGTYTPYTNMIFALFLQLIPLRTVCSYLDEYPKISLFLQPHGKEIWTFFLLIVIFQLLSKQMVLFIRMKFFYLC